ncbi:hypothetical protein ACLOJK_013138 [Asimina triloba]
MPHVAVSRRSRRADRGDPGPGVAGPIEARLLKLELFLASRDISFWGGEMDVLTWQFLARVEFRPEVVQMINPCHVNQSPRPPEALSRLQ